ncbi:MAG: hypothetical protein AAGM84_05480 [Pseudomonadota bacterium]
MNLDQFRQRARNIVEAATKMRVRQDDLISRRLADIASRCTADADQIAAATAFELTRQGIQLTSTDMIAGQPTVIETGPLDADGFRRAVMTACLTSETATVAVWKQRNADLRGAVERAARSGMTKQQIDQIMMEELRSAKRRAADLAGATRAMGPTQ